MCHESIPFFAWAFDNHFAGAAQLKYQRCIKIVRKLLCRFLRPWSDCCVKCRDMADLILMLSPYQWALAVLVALCAGLIKGLIGFANNFYYGAEFRRDAQFGLGCDDITDSSHESVSGISHRNSCGRSIDHS